MVDETFISWTRRLPDWQRDALRRIALKRDLDNFDREEVFAQLRHSCGISDSCDLASVPLEEEHIPETVSKGPKVVLCSLGGTKHVNRLAPGQTLAFAQSGITLIYGENGSGKTGYCRILKKICRTRGSETVLGNVFLDADKKPAEARIRYILDGEETVRESHWIDGVLSDGLLPLAVFDSRSARLYVDEKNQVEFVPIEIELLERLADLLVSFEEDVKNEIQAIDLRLNQPLAEFGAGTPASVILSKLSTTTPISALPDGEQIEAAAGWSEDYENQLSDLQATLSQDPKSLALQCHRSKELLEALSAEIGAAAQALEEDFVAALKSACERAQTASDAAALAAAERFHMEPLPLVDLNAWRLMYDYAKAYSERVYPAVPPPAARLGDRCVLCQQELSDEARERLARFADFVAGRAAEELQAAEDAKRGAMAKFMSLPLRSEYELVRFLAEFRGKSQENGKLADRVVEFFAAARKRRDAAVEAAKTGSDFGVITPLPAPPLAALAEAIKELVRAEASYESEAQTGWAKAEIRAKRDALHDRKLLSQIVPAVRARLNDLLLRNKLIACRSTLSTKKISHQVSALREKLITGQLDKLIKTELEALHLSGVPFVLKGESRKGSSHVEVALDAKRPATKREVLSEGEQRALALAYFLAEVTGDAEMHGLVIDDPVSSLDKDRIVHVARRLVNEAAKGKQVIIFTHSVPFYQEICSHAAAHSSPVPVLTHVVSLTSTEGAGVVQDKDVPWIAKKTSLRFEYMERLLSEFKSQETGSDGYTRRVKEFYTHMRETWERLVEELLLGGVVQRYCADVKTQSLKKAVIEDEDYRTVFWAVKRVSVWSGHDMPPGRDVAVPSIEDMKRDLESIKKYHKSIKKRADEVEKRRKELEKPPVARVV